MKRNGCLATVIQGVHDCIMMILLCAVSVCFDNVVKQILTSLGFK